MKTFLCVFAAGFVTKHYFSMKLTSASRVLVSGASGYIGRSVVRELVSRGIDTGALIRPNSVVPSKTLEYLNGAELIECDVLNSTDTYEKFRHFNPSATICCLASRSGVTRDSWDVDYSAGLNTLNALAELSDSRHFVLLSAYCCGKPLLQFQFAKLKLEEAIRQSSVSHSVVRPTAYFKSLDGQIESVRGGNPVLLFGDGSTAANAICENDLAKYLVDCAVNSTSLQMMNATRNVGGPDVPPLTKRQQAELIFDTLKVPADARRIVYLPLAIFTVLISVFSTLAKALDNTKYFPGLQQKLDDAAELARIVRYYATEPMVAVGPGEVHGQTSLRDHFNKLAARGGVLDEVDPMTTTAGVLSVFSNNTYLGKTVN